MEICWTELKVKEVLKLEDTMMPYQLLHMQTAKLDTTLMDKTLQISASEQFMLNHLKHVHNSVYLEL